jgi:hypothetical protein
MGASKSPIAPGRRARPAEARPSTRIAVLPYCREEAGAEAPGGLFCFGPRPALAAGVALGKAMGAADAEPGIAILGGFWALPLQPPGPGEIRERRQHTPEKPPEPPKPAEWGTW